jgi:hypothetical protein
MVRLITREFKPNAPVYVRRFFVAAGRHWNPGDLFDWQRLSVAQRRVKQLFDAGKLMHPEGQPITGPKPDVVLASMSEAPIEGADFTADVQTETENDTILADAAPPLDELDDLDMKELRAIAAAEDAPSRVSREAQREAIRENRKAKAADTEGAGDVG